MRAQCVENAVTLIGPLDAVPGAVNVVVSVAPTAGIEAALAATSSVPAQKISCAVAAPATGPAPFPTLLDQIVEAESRNLPSFRNGGTSGSKAATAGGGAQKKATAEKRRTSEEHSADDSGQSLAASGSPNAQQPPSQDWRYGLAGGIASPWPETSGDNTEGRAATTWDDMETGAGTGDSPRSGPTGTTSGAVTLAKMFPDVARSGPAGRAPSNHSAAAASDATAEPSDDARAKLLAEVPASPTPAGAELDASGGAPSGAHREQEVAVSWGQTADSERRRNTDGSAGFPISVAGRMPAASIRNNTATRAAEGRAAGPGAAAGAARGVSAGGADMATPPVTRSAAAIFEFGHTNGDTVDNEQSGTTITGGTGATPLEAVGIDTSAGDGTLAFQAVLVPMRASDPQPAFQQTPQGGGSSGQGLSLDPGDSLSAERSSSRSPRDLGSGLAGESRLSQSDNPAGATQTANGFAMVVPSSASTNAADAAVARDRSKQEQAAPFTAKSTSSQAVTAEDSAAKTVPGSAAREIQLELRDADSRVSVRLVERAGSVQVQVRTPDSHLAGTLRDDLPTLTQRLEQTGLRAETVRDAPVGAAARIRTPEPAATAGFPSSRDPSQREGGGRDPQDGQQQQKRQNRPQPGSKEFSWFYKSL